MQTDRNDKPRILHPGKIKSLRSNLDSLLQRFTQEEYVRNDPLGEVLKFDTRADREVAAFVAAAFAFGNIKSILSHLRKIWHVTGMDIAAFTKRYFFNPDFPAPKYRWITPQATFALFHVLGEILRTHSSIERFFDCKPRDSSRGSYLTETLQSFSQRALSLAPEKLKKPDLRRLSYFFSSPSGGGACKRLNLFLRWVVRKDPPDLGLWSCLSPAELVIPLDVHIARVAAQLGLTSRKTKDWKMAAQITDALRRIDPHDPLRYDFALHKLGVTRKC